MIRTVYFKVLMSYFTDTDLDCAYNLVVLFYKMPSGKKVLPKSRKRLTASARARISVSKAREVINKESNGSY